MVVHISEALPLDTDGLTAEWFSEVLGVPVASTVTRDIVWGTATKVLVDVEYAEPNPDLPTAICVKGGFDERLRAMGESNVAYHFEAKFFGEIARSLPVRLPRSFYTGVAATSNQGIVLMDNLRDQAGRFGDPNEPLTPDEVAAGLESQAKWHAATSPNPTAVAAWLPKGSKAVRDTAALMLSEQYWAHHFAQPESPKLPDALNARSVIANAFTNLWIYEDAQPGMLSHGDAHIGNTFLWSDGTMMYIDWQGVCIAPWSYDVAYFVTGGLSVADRRASEMDLLEHYRKALAAEGGPELTTDQVWDGYRRHALHGFLWATTPSIMQTPERVRNMTERHAAAIEDLDTLSVLG
jgi:phosphotransferase family enzyme